MTTFKQAINDSDYNSAEHIDANGYGYYVDGTQDGYDLSAGVDGMPVEGQGHYETVEQLEAALPSSVATSNRWEPVGEEVEDENEND